MLKITLCSYDWGVSISTEHPEDPWSRILYRQDESEERGSTL